MKTTLLVKKLKEVRAIIDECLQSVDGGTTPQAEQKKKKARETKTEANQDDLVLQIVNKTGDCDESENIQTNVLDSKKMEAKILLCFYISHKYFGNTWLNSGHIEKITSDLGIKIDKRNVTNKLKSLRQYLENGSTRQKGQPTPYRLNRKGVKRFEDIIADQK